MKHLWRRGRDVAKTLQSLAAGDPAFPHGQLEVRGEWIYVD